MKWLGLSNELQEWWSLPRCLIASVNICWWKPPWCVSRSGLLEKDFELVESVGILREGESFMYSSWSEFCWGEGLKENGKKLFSHFVRFKAYALLLPGPKKINWTIWMSGSRAVFLIVLQAEWSQKCSGTRGPAGPGRVVGFGNFWTVSRPWSSHWSERRWLSVAMAIAPSLSSL